LHSLDQTHRHASYSITARSMKCPFGDIQSGHHLAVSYTFHVRVMQHDIVVPGSWERPNRSRPSRAQGLNGFMQNPLELFAACDLGFTHYSNIIYELRLPQYNRIRELSQAVFDQLKEPRFRVIRNQPLDFPIRHFGWRFPYQLHD